MKKFTWIALIVCGLAVASHAQTSSKSETTSQNTEVKVSDDNLLASTVDSKTTVSDNSTLNPTQQKAEAKKWKKWKNRTLAGKILICTGVGVFVVLCLMFGTVSVG